MKTDSTGAMRNNAGKIIGLTTYEIHQRVILVNGESEFVLVSTHGNFNRAQQTFVELHDSNPAATLQMIKIIREEINMFSTKPSNGEMKEG